MKCTSEMKAQMAIYKLENDASHWWDNTEIILRAQNIPITWEIFKARFDEKYFPRSIRDDKEAEFLTISQGANEPFEDYLSRFNQLSRYYTHLDEGNDGRWLASRLVRGLIPYMREQITPMEIEDFVKAIEVCRLTESCRVKPVQALRDKRPENVSYLSEEVSQKRKELFPAHQRNPSKKQQQQQQPQPRNHQELKISPISNQRNCSNCGRNHSTSPCLAGQNICYFCQKPGHYANECWKKNKLSKPTQPGKLFVMTHEGVQKTTGNS